MPPVTKQTSIGHAQSHRYLCHPGGVPHEAVMQGSCLTIKVIDRDAASAWRLHHAGDQAQLDWLGPCSTGPDTPELLAALEATFALHPAPRTIRVVAPLPRQSPLFTQGILRRPPDEPIIAQAGLFWQQQHPWLAGTAAAPYPLDYVMTGAARHPRRPPKPASVVYRRHIPWLQATLSLRVATEELDAVRLNLWMNDPTVAHFWEEAGPIEKHRAYLRKQTEDAHTLPLVICLDGVPFGYVEAYWAREDRIAAFCGAADHDRGWHVLIGDPAYRGQHFVSAWMPSISHYLFLDDPRTQRLVIEPRIDNAKMLRSLARSGYALEKTFDFPHKRAMLGTLTRERFFNESLWVPRAADGITPQALAPLQPRQADRPVSPSLH